MRNCKHCGIELPELRKGLSCVTCKNGMDRYNMNRNDMIALHESQDYKCKLCSKEVKLFSRRLHDSGYIDHNHTTGKVRAILCHPCNTSIGYLENAGIDLNKLTQYLVP
jgi:hypothetical protein